MQIEVTQDMMGAIFEVNKLEELADIQRYLNRMKVITTKEFLQEAQKCGLTFEQFDILITLLCRTVLGDN